MVDVEIQFAVSPLARDHVTDPSLPRLRGQEEGEQWQNAGKRGDGGPGVVDRGLVVDPHYDRPLWSKGQRPSWVPPSDFIGLSDSDTPRTIANR